MDKIFNCKTYDKLSNNNFQYYKFKSRRNTYIYIPIINNNIVISSLNLYNPSNIIKKIYKNLLMNALNFLDVKYLFRNKINANLNTDILECIDNVENYKYAAIYTGTPGNTSKYTIQLMDDKGDILGYAKVPKGKKSSVFISKEKENLEYVNNLNLERCKLPNLLYFDNKSNILVQSTIIGLEDVNNKLTQNIIDFLIEINHKTYNRVDLKESEFYKKAIYMIDNYPENIKSRISKSIYHLCEVYKLKDISYCFSHKDFTPWNIKKSENFIYVFDWEMSGYTPMYYDIFNYIYFVEILVNKSSVKTVIDNILNNKYIECYEEQTCRYNRKAMLIIYIIELIYLYKEDLNQEFDNIIINKAIEVLDLLII
ncbi:phosphotransferase [Romboutsia timonensis]|uniref:phosphotransferase n=1 Tax=Romboutsia timonensis TaxID=1776391 RepID=UPI002A8159FD|nr:phosphotransferase [Romboutsia timonensis]MDY3959069.1 phosphotransferase [Romboutsia timonensis]